LHVVNAPQGETGVTWTCPWDGADGA